MNNTPTGLSRRRYSMVYAMNDQSNARQQTHRGNAASQFIDAAALMQIKSLELRAKTVVNGLWSGIHRSPLHGFSAEFTEYRDYSPGDDLRYLDWRVYARSDRYFVKRFEDETSLRCHFLLDLSRSMGFAGGDYSKAEYAKTLTASFAHFLLSQRDSVGLATFSSRVEGFIPARHRTGHLRRLLLALDRPAAGEETDLVRPLTEIAERVKKRGLLVLVSDLLAPLETFRKELGYLTALGHEAVIFQVLDPAELSLEFENAAWFQDIESGRELYVDPQRARRDYQRRLAEHLDRIRMASESLGITYRLVSTGEPLELVLGDFLRTRRHCVAGGRGGRQSGRVAA